MPVLINENDPVNGNPWGIKFMTMFHMSNDSHLFHTRDELEADGWTLNGNVFERSLSGADSPRNGLSDVERMLPLYEAKMIHHYDHQWATYEPDGSVRIVTPDEKVDPSFAPMPRYWVHESELAKVRPDAHELPRLFGFRNIARSTDARTFIGSLIPLVPVGHSMPIMFADRPDVLQAAFTSFVVDFALRQKLGGTTLTYNHLQQPMPSPVQVDRARLLIDRPASPWIANRVDRLNAWPSSSETRSTLRAELDAAMFLIYGIGRDDVEYILEPSRS